MTITLYIQPGAKKTEFAGVFNGCRKLKVNAPPVAGAANEAILSFIAQTLDAPKSSLSLVKGEKSRVKTIKVDKSRVKNTEALALFSL
jgi:uncharacterized protein (TIGR00251 family)